MKVGRDYSWYVAFEWEYDYLDRETGKWESYYDNDARRFYCVKKDIKKAVTEYVKKYEIADNEEYRKLKVSIINKYMTTPEEI